MPRSEIGDLAVWGAEDPSILSANFDVQGKRVDLPCDEDGQVFLAPIRKYEPGSSDDVITQPLGEKPPSDELMTVAKALPADHTPPLELDHPRPSFEVSNKEHPARKEQPESPTEQLLDHLPAMPADITAEIDGQDQTELSPAMQGVQTIRKRWSDEPVIPSGLGKVVKPDIFSQQGEEKNELHVSTSKDSTQTPALRRSFLKPAGSVAKKAVLGMISAPMSLLGVAGRLTKMTVSGIAAILLASWRWTNWALKTSMSGTLVFGTAAVSRMTTIAKITFHATIRFARNLTTIYVAAVMWLSEQAWRMARSLAGQSYQDIVLSCAKAKQALVSFTSWLLSIGRKSLSATSVLGGMSSSALSKTWKASVTHTALVWSTFRQRFLGIPSAVFAMLSRTGAGISALGWGISSRTMAVSRKAHQFLSKTSERLSASIQWIRETGTSLAAKGKSFAMDIIRGGIRAVRSASGGMARTYMAGLAASAACLFLVVIYWSDTSTSKQVFVIMAVPPKPAPVPAKPPQHDPLVFDWPSPEDLPTKHDISLPVDETPTDLTVSTVGGSLSPDEALTALIKGVTPLGLTDEPSRYAVSTSVAFVEAKPDTDVRLATLILLADIEAVAGAGEFLNAVRMVGLDTLIQPGQSYTMLVPSDEAFAKLGRDKLAALLDPEGHDDLRILLSNHILSERLTFSDFAGETGSYLSMADQPITIAATGVVKVEEASMIKTDLHAANTIVHIIDEILMPSQLWNNEPLQAVTEIEQASDI